MKKFLHIFVVALLAACSRDETPVEPRLVVEGWIESGRTPVVMVTTTVTPNAQPQKVSALTDHIKQWARVAVWDGDTEIILTGVASKRYFPPFYFTTGEFTGKPGQSYRLTVDVDGFHAESSATVQQPLALDSLEPIPYGQGDSLYLLKARFTGTQHFKFFTLMEGTDGTYVPAITGLASAPDGAATEVTIRPGNSLQRIEKRPAFRAGETVQVKFCTMDEGMYRMWETLDDLIYLDTTPFFTLDTNLPGNVTGAMGYFAGYGRTDYAITLPSSK
ncbi:MAG: DUF4249 family protein [Bacteroidales bacterium]|nr:DUF4249 family protein [Bacteroidales bacterium]